MSVGGICFTSSNSSGGCWVVLAPPPFGKKGFPPPYATYAKIQKFYATYTKKVFLSKNATYAKKESYATYAHKKKASYAHFHN